jgi:DNA-binding beta-propeller fold protein YncE
VDAKSSALGAGVYAGDGVSALVMDEAHGLVWALVHESNGYQGDGYYLVAIDKNGVVVTGSDRYITQGVHYNMVLDPTRGLIYIPDGVAGKIHIFNTADETVTDVLVSHPEGLYPQAAKFNKKENRVYILGLYNNVFVFEGYTMLPTVHIPIGLDSAISLAINPVTGDIYSGCDYDLDGGPSGFIVTINNAKIVSTLRLGIEPSGGVYNPIDGKMWWVDYFADNGKGMPEGGLEIVSPDGTYVTKVTENPFAIGYNAITGYVFLNDVNHPAMIFVKPRASKGSDFTYQPKEKPCSGSMDSVRALYHRHR